MQSSRSDFRLSRSTNYKQTFRDNRQSIIQTRVMTLGNVPGYDPINSPFTLMELQIAISSRSNTSPGIDNICYPMLKYLSEQSLLHMLNLFNTSWEQGHVPDPWKAAIIILILKKDKEATSAESYRPISSTSSDLQTNGSHGRKQASRVHGVAETPPFFPVWVQAVNVIFLSPARCNFA